jgi:HEAT repeat protein
MQKDIQSLFELLCASQTYENLHKVMDQLRTMGDFSDDLLEAMHKELKARNWRCLSLLTGCVLWFPDRKFTLILCELLDHHKDHFAALEDIADLLHDIRDERSVPSLIRVIEYYIPGDDDRHFNRKILHALANIGNEQAIEGLRNALQSPEEEIKEASKRELTRFRIAIKPVA